jgi:Tfp pilus assembly protein PilX
MGIKHLREDEKGSGLVLTLMVLLVLSVLGVSIGTLTLGSYRLSDANRDDTSAYYVAEAGAVAAYEEIQSEVLSAYKSSKTDNEFYGSIKSLVSGQEGASPVKFEPQFGSTPTATIKTAQKDSKTYTITSTGEVDGKQRTVTKQFTVTWVEKNTGGGGLPTLPANAALLTKEDIKISEGVKIDGNIYTDGDVNIPNGNIKGNIYANGGVTITDGMLNGDIYTNSTKKDAFDINGWINLRSSTLFHSNKITADELLEYPKNYTNFPRLEAKDNVWDGNNYLQNFQGYKDLLVGIKAPDINELVKKSDLKISGENELKLDSDVYFEKIESNSNADISINTNGKDRIIVVDTLNVGGKLKVTGDGKLTIYITNKFQINQNGRFINEEGSLSQLTFVYLGEGAFHLDNNNKINGHLIVKNANVKVGSVAINGVFLIGSKSVQLTGGNAGSNMMLIAPNAAVTLKEGYSIQGTVIANEFNMSGGASLKYAAINTTGFPFGSAAPAADPEPKDIISSEPIIEN